MIAPARPDQGRALTAEQGRDRTGSVTPQEMRTMSSMRLRPKSARWIKDDDSAIFREPLGTFRGAAAAKWVPTSSFGTSTRFDVKQQAGQSHNREECGPDLGPGEFGMFKGACVAWMFELCGYFAEVCMSVLGLLYIRKHIHVWVCTYIASLDVHKSYASTQTCMYASIQTCIYIYIYIYMYIYMININLPLSIVMSMHAGYNATAAFQATLPKTYTLAMANPISKREYVESRPLRWQTGTQDRTEV